MEPEHSPSTTDPKEPVAANAVLCRIGDAAELAMFASQPDPLHHIGFTGFLYTGIREESSQRDLDILVQSGLTVAGAEQTDTAITLFTQAEPGANVVWGRLAGASFTDGSDLSQESSDRRSNNEANTLLQMSIPPVPIVPVSPPLLYSGALREPRELLRSLVFWRKRFEIARHKPNLVHAGDDGLLIFTVDSWLVTINQNPEEAAIDLGSHGSMWLMLGTQRDVHLHGSMLILPPFSGAIVANELAR